MVSIGKFFINAFPPSGFQKRAIMLACKMLADLKLLDFVSAISSTLGTPADGAQKGHGLAEI